MDRLTSYDLHIQARRHRSAETARVFTLVWSGTVRVLRQLFAPRSAGRSCGCPLRPVVRHGIVAPEAAGKPAAQRSRPLRKPAHDPISGSRGEGFEPAARGA